MIRRFARWNPGFSRSGPCAGGGPTRQTKVDRPSGGCAVERTAPDRLRRKEDSCGVKRRAGGGDETLLLGGGGNSRVSHQESNQGRWGQSQVPTAELVGLDSRMISINMNQPAVVVQRDAQLDGKWAARLGQPAAPARAECSSGSDPGQEYDTSTRIPHSYPDR